MSFWKIFSNEGLYGGQSPLKIRLHATFSRIEIANEVENQTYHDKDFLPDVSNLAVSS